MYCRVLIWWFWVWGFGLKEPSDFTFAGSAQGFIEAGVS